MEYNPGEWQTSAGGSFIQLVSQRFFVEESTSDITASFHTAVAVLSSSGRQVAVKSAEPVNKRLLI
jgi:CxxC motif-containing protein